MIKIKSGVFEKFIVDGYIERREDGWDAIIRIPVDSENIAREVIGDMVE